jgi:hypothetical protein
MVPRDVDAYDSRYLRMNVEAQAEFGKHKDLNRTGASFANASNGTGTPLDNMY